MEHEEARRRMQEIQRIMERTTLYTVLPGASAIIGGALVLIGCLATWLMIRSADFQEVVQLPRTTKVAFFVMWVVIAIIAVVQDIVLTARAARGQGVAPVGRPGKFAALSLTPSVFVAAILTIKLVHDGRMDCVAPVWMMCYGTGVYAAGMFSFLLPRLLGIAFIGMGAIGLLFLSGCGLILAALSFGMLHIAFGLIVLSKAQRSNQE